MSLRIALLGGGCPAVSDLRAALEDLGHQPVLSGAPAGGRLAKVMERLLHARGFPTSHAQVPLVARSLSRGGFDLVHAFSADDAAVAVRWGQRAGKPVVFTCVDPPTRESLADRRGRLESVVAALDADVVTAADEQTRTAIEHWLARDVDVVPLTDGAAYEALYRGAVAQT